MWRRIAGWWRREKETQDFEEEIRAHIAIEALQGSDAEKQPQDTERAARLAFGNVTRIREDVRDVWRIAWLDDLWQDIRYGVRTLRRNPGFTAVASVTLALGIGANTAIFSVLNGVLLEPLPYPNSEQLVQIFENIPASETPLGRPQRSSLPAIDLRLLQTAARSFAEIDMYGTALELRLGHDEETDLPGARVSRKTLLTLGAAQVIGRLFDDRESETMEPVLILSQRAWERWFNADPQVLGRSVVVEGSVPPPYGLPRRIFTVIGVMAEGFRFPSDQTQFWVPLNMDREGGSANIARLRESVSARAASDEVNAILLSERRASTEARAQPRFEVVAIQDERAASIRPALQILFVAVGLVLLIACANVANLLLARATVREREMSVRTSLGAAQGRLVRQMVTEGIILALLGGVIGWLLAIGGLRIIRSSLQGLTPLPNIRQVGSSLGQLALPGLDGVGLDISALWFTAGVCLLIGMLFGLVPSLRRSNRPPIDGLRAGAASGAGGFGLFRRNAGRSLLVAGQIALAVSLLVTGGLLINSFVRLLVAEKGYDASNVLTFQIRAPRGHFSNQQLRQFSDDLVTRIEALPGVRSAAYGILPLVSFIQNVGFQISPGEQLPPAPMGDQSYSIYNPELRLMSPRYLEVMGMRIVAGQGFSTSESSVKGLLINGTLARGRFAGSDAVGKLVYIGGEPRQILGVVGDVRQQGVDIEPAPQVFINFAEWDRFNEIADDPRYYSVRVSDNPMGFLGGIREAVRQLDSQIMLDNVATMEELVASSIARPRVYALLLGAFAALAVMLAAVGTYGVMSYAVTQNTKEIGLRIALGARPSEVLGLVITKAAVLAGVGIAVGLAIAGATTGYLRAWVFGLTPFDIPTYIAVAVLFFAIALIASYLPARRAAHVDPLVALRTE